MSSVVSPGSFRRPEAGFAGSTAGSISDRPSSGGSFELAFATSQMGDSRVTFAVGADVILPVRFSEGVTAGADGSFTIVTPGTYEVVATLQASTSGNFYVALRKNGVLQRPISMLNGSPSTIVELFPDLDAGDVFSFENGSASVTIESSESFGPEGGPFVRIPACKILVRRVA